MELRFVTVHNTPLWKAALLVSSCSPAHPRPHHCCLPPPTHTTLLHLGMMAATSELYRNKSPDRKPLISPPPTYKATLALNLA